MYRFLLTPRWLGGLLFVVCAVAFCTFMGSWQLGRFEDRVQTHRAAQDAPSRDARTAAVPLAELLPTVRSVVTAETSGRTVTATGRYDGAHQFLVPGRELDGRTGYYVLTPLRVTGGQALPVVRGWLPGDASKASPAAVPAAPSDEVTVSGALQAPETDSTDGVVTRGGLPAGQLGMISAASLVNLVPYPVYGAWITQTEGVPAPLTAVPPAAPAGTGLDLKAFQNLGYTGEWFVFAGFVLFMYVRLLRREAETRRDAALGLVEQAPEAPAAASAAQVPADEVQLQP
ncbi:SURF1 family protein [Streptomyces sp. NPDC088354]|uniref:SURF1 family protein n=1 Tax=unclassified Streptomyces TaxID=2593676 RepID=UPI0029BF80C9|nr:SURF1 family protein [Streptomyces sp. MI02-7b]MDX3076812.1 SURF1 family protein [Streptomyces sp. MI02-7b]